MQRKHCIGWKRLNYRREVGPARGWVPLIRFQGKWHASCPLLVPGTSAHSTLFADVAVWHAHNDNASLESTFRTTPTMQQTRGVPVLFLVDKRRQTDKRRQMKTNEDKRRQTETNVKYTKGLFSFAQVRMKHIYNSYVFFLPLCKDFSLIAKKEDK